MVDTQLSSLRTSSLYRVLTKGENDKEDYTVSIGKSKAPCGHELLVVPVGNGGEIATATTGNTFTVDLPKLGTCVSAFLKIKVKGLQNASVPRGANTNTAAAGSTPDRLHCASIPGVAFIKKLSLKTHSRTIAEMTQETLMALINTMEEDRRNMTIALAGGGIKASLDGGATGKPLSDRFQITTGCAGVANHVTNLYVPILLNAFESKFGLMTSFLETCSLEIEFHNVNRVFSAGFVSGGSSSAGSSYKADLCIQCKSYRDDVYRSVLQQYRSNPSVQQLGWRMEKVGSQTKPVTSINDGTTLYHNLDFDIHTSSSSLSRAIIVTVSRLSNGSYTRTGGGTLDPDLQALANVSLGPTNPAIIDSVTFSASGREVFTSLSPEMELMSYANKHFSVPSSNIQTCFVHRFATEGALQSGDTMSGALSLAGCSSQRFVITGRAQRSILHFSGTADIQKKIGDIDAIYECSIYSISYNVKSTNSSSGALRNSLSV